ncbi:MAG: hypothetical protein RIS64_1622, partial [Bacteroidota bacterium]
DAEDHHPLAGPGHAAELGDGEAAGDRLAVAEVRRVAVQVEPDEGEQHENGRHLVNHDFTGILLAGGCYIFFRCRITVSTLTYNFSAIVLESIPCATPFKTSNSRGENKSVASWSAVEKNNILSFASP